MMAAHLRRSRRPVGHVNSEPPSLPEALIIAAVVLGTPLALIAAVLVLVVA